MMLDRRRLQDFKQKFDQELRKRDSVPVQTSSNSSIRISIAEHVKPITNDTEEAPSTSSVPAPIVVRPVPFTSSPGPLAEDLLKALKSANQLIQKFYVSVFDDNSDGELCGGNLKCARAGAIGILKGAANGDAELAHKLIRLFNSQNKLKDEAVKMIISKQRRHFKTTIDNLVQKRFGDVERVSIHWSHVKDCGSSEELEEKLQLVDDPLELELIKTFQDPYDTAYYMDAKKKKLAELYKSWIYLREYDKEMAIWIQKSGCLDAEDVDRVSKSVLGKLTLPQFTACFQKRVAGAIEEINYQFKGQVQSKENLCIEKAVEHACTRYGDILKGNESTEVDVNTLHRIVYFTVFNKFKNVENFKYSKKWKWPAVQPVAISKHLEEAREAEKGRKVIADGFSLVKKMKPDEQLKVLEKHFPQFVNKPQDESDSEEDSESESDSTGGSVDAPEKEPAGEHESAASEEDSESECDSSEGSMEAPEEEPVGEPLAKKARDTCQNPSSPEPSVASSAPFPWIEVNSAVSNVPCPAAPSPVVENSVPESKQETSAITAEPSTTGTTVISKPPGSISKAHRRTSATPSVGTTSKTSSAPSTPAKRPAQQAATATTSPKLAKEAHKLDL